MQMRGQQLIFDCPKCGKPVSLGDGVHNVDERHPGIWHSWCANDEPPPSGEARNADRALGPLEERISDLKSAMRRAIEMIGDYESSEAAIELSRALELNCKQCGTEMAPGWARLCRFCKACMETAMDELTTVDIANCVTEMIRKRAYPGDSK